MLKQPLALVALLCLCTVGAGAPEIDPAVETMTAEESIQWAVNEYGDNLAMTSSFGIHSALLLHMVSAIKPNIPVIFIDTGYLPAETYQYMEHLKQEMGLNVTSFQSEVSPARMEAVNGKLWETDHRAYGQMRKVEPMMRGFKTLGAAACFAGLRSTQTSHRSSLKKVHSSRGTMKILPILDWTDKEVDAYFETHSLPRHPLASQGYVSVGDTHSSRPVGEGDADGRDTRFAGKHAECGMHLDEDADVLEESEEQKAERLEKMASDAAAIADEGGGADESLVVEIYSKPSCRYCKATKEHLTKRGIKYIDHTIEKRADWGALQHRAMECCKADITKVGKPNKLLVLVPHVFVGGKWAGTYRKPADLGSIDEALLEAGLWDGVEPPEAAVEAAVEEDAKEL
jgi:phosphoadenosine phosphosulfate reductase